MYKTELAEYVLNRGITNHDESGKLVVYDFQLLDYEGGSEDNEVIYLTQRVTHFRDERLLAQYSCKYKLSHKCM